MPAVLGEGSAGGTSAPGRYARRHGAPVLRLRRWRDAAIPPGTGERRTDCRPSARGCMSELLIEPFNQVHLDRLLTLVAAEGWTEYSHDPERTYRALTAPGS